LVNGIPGLVILRNEDDTTAFNDPRFTRVIKDKAKLVTTTTCGIFDLLRRKEIPVAFREQFSPTEFVAENCRMIPLEVVTRRFVVRESSYGKRNPEFRPEEGEEPRRFLNLCVEFFLKTTDGRLIQEGKVLLEGLKPDEDDPLIVNPRTADWLLSHPKRPASDLNRSIRALVGVSAIEQMERYSRESFLVLEKAWDALGYYLIDWKLEFGMTVEGRLVIADSIDPDSFRLCDRQWVDFSKESFRQGKRDDEVRGKYRSVAKMVKEFRGLEL
jgi:phosphoribosylaminoimidazole carboxylase / phosphoribosylaminoimidazole-succinocarboxamide synthase